MLFHVDAALGLDLLLFGSLCLGVSSKHSEAFKKISFDPQRISEPPWSPCWVPSPVRETATRISEANSLAVETQRPGCGDVMFILLLLFLLLCVRERACVSILVCLSLPLQSGAVDSVSRLPSKLSRQPAFPPSFLLFAFSFASALSIS